MKTPDLWAIETEYYAKGFEKICGVDEAGAGPLAGRVYAAAVILPQNLMLPGLNDSKKVPEKRREALYEAIIEKALAWSVAWADEKEVDRLNILHARMLAMDRAIQTLKPSADFALVDGNRNIGITISNAMVVKGDAKSASIAAASILAKVSRDRYMCQMSKLYPEYAFDRHKGYPTKLHYERLQEYGFCPIHRITFLKNHEW